MSVELDALTVKVQETTTVAQSAIALINGLATQIADLKDDPAALQALADSLGASSTALAAAITANTPQASHDNRAEGRRRRSVLHRMPLRASAHLPENGVSSCFDDIRERLTDAGEKAQKGSTSWTRKAVN